MRHTKLSVLICKQRKYEGVATLASGLQLQRCRQLAPCTVLREMENFPNFRAIEDQIGNKNFDLGNSQFALIMGNFDPN